MSKKTLWILAVLAVALVAGGYWYYAHVVKPAPVVVHGPELPANGAAPSAPESTAPVSGKEATPESGSEAAKKIAPALPALRAGEALEYGVEVTKLDSSIATIKLVVIDEKGLAGKPAWHLQASAHTENPYRMIFELDDRFDSYSEPSALDSLQYEMHLSERGQKVDSVQRLLTSAKEAAPAEGTGARVLPGTRDPLGLLQYLRNVDWSKTTEVHSPVYDGRKLYEVRAMLKGRSETVTVPAGKFNASRIEIHVLDNGVESKDTHFLLYLANDSGRTPVLLEAVLPIATARVELTKAK